MLQCARNEFRAVAEAGRESEKNEKSVAGKKVVRMKKIVYLPLDERPCNYSFPKKILGEDNKDYFLVQPELSMMGKKKPADYEKIKEFLLTECRSAFGLIVSVDCLLYGGIVPSRLHTMNDAVLTERLALLEKIKKQNPAITIYAFSLIMRCPQYSSDDEEPDYYGVCGYEIFKLGELLHKRQLGMLTDEEEKAIGTYKEKTDGYLQDYLARREVNVRPFEIKTLRLV